MQAEENSALKTELSVLRDRLGAIEKAQLPTPPTSISGDPQPDERASVATPQAAHDVRCRGASAAVFTSLTLLFQRNERALNPEHHEQLTRVALLAKECRTMRVLVSGFTDNRGSDATHKRLSQHRAELVVEYLYKQDIDPKRVSIASFGSRYPMDSNASNEGRSKNRRVEVSARFDSPVPGDR